LLFCGDEFNYELTKVRTGWKISWQLVINRDYCSNVIDFGKYGNSSPEFIRNKILDIYTNSANRTYKNWNNYHSVGENNILFKNIDKITNFELKKELLTIFDTTKNINLGKYKKSLGSSGEIETIIDLSKFLLIATTSTSNPKISNDLRKKLNHVEPFLDKLFWTIILFSLGTEIVVFSLIYKRKNLKINNYMIILAIETSCDETSVAILENKKVLSNVTISQILEQKKYGGVMPSLAAKLHIKNIQLVLQKSLSEAKISPEKIDYVAYTEKPGLIICLQIGKIVAETFSLYLNKKLIPCNHLEGHIYASLLDKNEEWNFPALALIISGGHTQIYQLNKHLSFNLLGETLDDAIGECLDKSAVLLGYNYPGGPIIEKLALGGKNVYKLPLPKNDDSLDFSFSGLKSEVWRIVNREKATLNVNDLAFSLQNILLKILVKKLQKSWAISRAKSIIIGGGVIANKFLRNNLINEIKKWDKEIKIFFPEINYSTDNAAMIGILAYYKKINEENNQY